MEWNKIKQKKIKNAFSWNNLPRIDLKIPEVKQKQSIKVNAVEIEQELEKVEKLETVEIVDKVTKVEMVDKMKL